MKAVHFRPDLGVTEREQELKKLCVTEKEENFFRTLTDSDVDKEKHNYAEKGGELKQKKAEAKASADAFKGEISGIEKLQDEILERIQTRKRKVYDKLYGLANYGTGLMEYYDRFGEMIDSRKLTPDETTGHLFNNNGDATNAPASNEPKSIGYETKDLPDGQDKGDIQDAEFEVVDDKNEADPNAPDPDPNAQPAEDPETSTEKPKGKGGTKKPRKTNKKDDDTQTT